MAGTTIGIRLISAAVQVAPSSSPSPSSSPCRVGVHAPLSSGFTGAIFWRSQLPAVHGLRHGNVGKTGLVSERLFVHADYSGRRSGGGAGDFMAGFLLGGVLFGTVGYLLAPMISKSIATVKEIQEDDEVEDPPKKLPKYVDDEDGLEGTRKSLNEKIAQLNAAIDDVSAQLRADDGSFGMNESPVELESAA